MTPRVRPSDLIATRPPVGYNWTQRKQCLRCGKVGLHRSPTAPCVECQASPEYKAEKAEKARQRARVHAERMRKARKRGS